MREKNFSKKKRLFYKKKIFYGKKKIFFWVFFFIKIKRRKTRRIESKNIFHVKNKHGINTRHFVVARIKIANFFFFIFSSLPLYSPLRWIFNELQLLSAANKIFLIFSSPSVNYKKWKRNWRREWMKKINQTVISQARHINFLFWYKEKHTYLLFRRSSWNYTEREFSSFFFFFIMNTAASARVIYRCFFPSSFMTSR